jgi:hypothetical protein
MSAVMNSAMRAGMPARPSLPTLREAERLVGMAYEPGRFDCAHFAVLVQDELFGRTVADWLAARHPVRPQRQGELLLRCRDGLADRVEPEAVETGDVVLFTHWVGRMQMQQWHIGTLFVEGGERWVLHTSEGLGSSVLERLADCRSRGLQLDGFYRWKVQA